MMWSTPYFQKPPFIKLFHEPSFIHHQYQKGQLRLINGLTIMVGTGKSCCPNSTGVTTECPGKGGWQVPRGNVTSQIIVSQLGSPSLGTLTQTTCCARSSRIWPFGDLTLSNPACFEFLAAVQVCVNQDIYLSLDLSNQWSSWSKNDRCYSWTIFCQCNTNAACCSSWSMLLSLNKMNCARQFPGWDSLQLGPCQS